MGNHHSKSRHNKLISEIRNLKTTLLKLDMYKSKTEPRCCIADHAERISNLLQKQSHGQCFPIHELLRVSPLTNIEIPLDILDMLASEFDVNACDKTCDDSSRETCLGFAIANEHYNAVRCLIKHGADCNIEHITCDFDFIRYSPIALLAAKLTAPMNLFDLLQTDQTLNDNVNMNHLPLHVAIKTCHFEAALHMIQLGASVDIEVGHCSLPSIGFIYRPYRQERYFELFEKLVPSGRMDILYCVSEILETSVLDNEIRCKMFYHLVQRLIHIDVLYVTFESHRNVTVMIIESSNHSTGNTNNQLRRLGYPLIDFESGPYLWPVKGLYLISLLILHLNWNCRSVRESIAIALVLRSKATEQHMAHVHAIDGIWNSYLLNPNITSLLSLCIQQTRKHMNSLTDSSFMSLPVPSYIRKLLMYRHITDIVWEAWRVWPECNTTST